VTVRGAEKITMLRIEPTTIYSPKYGFLGFDTKNNICAWASGATKKEALEKLVSDNYQRVSKIVLERAGYRCQKCNKVRPLQVHHPDFRSHGRVDSLDTLVTRCAECHSEEHRQKRGLKALV
jgi:5-methylcytosine-specific restriction endonuclease McrA